MKMNLTNVQRGTLSLSRGNMLEPVLMSDVDLPVLETVPEPEEEKFLRNTGRPIFRRVSRQAMPEYSIAEGETRSAEVINSGEPQIIPNQRRADTRILQHIPTSQAVTGMEVRLSKVFIKDNRTPTIGPFVRYSNLYVITSSLDNLGCASYALSLKGFADVDDGEALPIDRTIYYWKAESKKNKIPGAIHILTSILKSNERIRNFGAALASLRETDDFKALIKKAIAAAAGGAAVAVEEALLPLIGVVGEILGKIDDKPLFTNILSFTDINGDFDKLGRHRITKRNRYADVVTTLIVRDVNT